ncbi:cobalt-precorrin 5A hydrolase / precorrin-3B C17-methyltransferase [uncultured Gammaproteobacteria bacterium]
MALNDRSPNGQAAPVLITLTPGGVPLCRRLKAMVPGSEIHGLAGRVAEGDADRLFTATAEHLRGLFRAGRPIVGVCAAGVLIRSLAPLLGDKWSEPPVLALAEDGSAVIPLLGGHHGAHALARTYGEALNVQPAITTAGDVRFGVALDDPPLGWCLANPADAKAFAGALLAGASVRLEGEAPWLTGSRLPLAADGGLTIHATEQALTGSAQALVYHPAVLAVGVGVERDGSAEELKALIAETLAAHGLSPLAVAGLFSIEVKSDEPAVHAAAAALGVPARFFDAVALEAQAPRLVTPSEVVFRNVGCHGVSEGAALAASGPEGVLIVAKAKSRGATCAIARSPIPLDATKIGRPRGKLSVVGLGPGGLEWRTANAVAALAAMDDLVGYKLYTDLAKPLASHVTLYEYGMGDEEIRARKALDLAAQGRKVVLVTSGDPGIYAMATLVFELLDHDSRPDWLRVEVEVVPGISAFQAGAALIGAPLAHDFCLISLSDLLTPWELIVRRLEAAAAADMAVALYNPVSRGRRHQLETAVEIFLRHRSPETPAVIGRQLGRPDQSVTVVRLGDLTPDLLDMLSIVTIGSSETRRMARPRGGEWVYTPRGFSGKASSGMREVKA